VPHAQGDADHQGRDQQTDRQEQTPVDDLIHVHKGDVVQAEPVEMADTDKDLAPVDLHEARTHFDLAGGDLREHLPQRVLIGGKVDQAVDGLAVLDRLGERVEVGEARIAMCLQCAHPVDKHRLHAGLRKVDDLPNERGEVDACPKDTEALSPSRMTQLIHTLVPTSASSWSTLRWRPCPSAAVV
jgi:hypothetical protein